MLLVVGEVPIDIETFVVTSSISRFVGPTRFFGGAHRGICGDFINLEICQYVQLGSSEVLIGIGCACV
jgi:hypothetical protein